MNHAPTIRIVDLFAGAGGFSLGAITAGASVVAAVENDKHAASTYRSNFCQEGADSPILYEQDIRSIDPQQFAKKHFRDFECDLLVGGPPCQGFSTHRILDAGVDDPRNELLQSYFDFLSALSPKAFLVENVPGMLWPRHQRHVEKFYEQAQAAGYQVFAPTVLDAKYFGVPQRRKRVFILGVRNNIANKSDISWPPLETHGSPDRLETQKPGWLSCGSVFETAPVDDPNNVHMNHTPALIEVFKSTPPNGGSRHESGRELPCHKKHDGHKDVYGRIDPALPAPTMTTACINPSKGRFVHPVEHHGLTVRQAARIQTFPDDFVFDGGLMAAGKQVGNAVPVFLAKLLIEHIAAQLGEAGNAQAHATTNRVDTSIEQRLTAA